MAIPTVTEVEEFKEDLDDAEALVNGFGQVVTRLGGTKDSYSLLVSRIAHGDITEYDPPDSNGPGTQYTQITDWVTWLGVVYRPDPAQLPIGPEDFDANKWFVAQGHTQADGIVPPVETYAAALALPTSLPLGAIVPIYGQGIAGDFVVTTGAISASSTGVKLSNATWNAAGKYLARVYDGPIRPSWFGAAADGVTNDTSALSDFFAAITDYATADLEGKKYLVTAGALSISGVDNFKIFGSGAAIIESAANEENLISIDNCNNFRIKDIFFEGAEDLAYWEANDTSTSGRAAFIKLDKCTKSRIRDVQSDNKRMAIWLQDCHRCSVSEVIHEGFCPDHEVTAVTGANVLSAIFVNGGSRNKVYNVDVDDHGSAVLVGTDSVSPLVYNITGDNIHDNVVYLSSASKGIVYAVNSEHSSSQCVKTRGFQNITFGCVAKDCSGDAFRMTGNGLTLDSDGANGHSNIIALCVANDTGNDGTSGGIGTGAQDGGYARDSIIALNIINDNNATGSGAAISGVMKKGGIYLGNIVSDYDTDQAITVATGGGGTATNKNAIIAFNYAGSNSAADQAFNLIGADQNVVIGNTSSDVTKLIESSLATDTLFMGNVNPDGRVVNFKSGAEGTNNFVIGNRGTTGNGSSQASADNFPVASVYPIASTPLYAGQMTISGGEYYIAIGVSSSADWVQITN